MKVQFQHMKKKSSTEYEVHFSVKPFLQSKEYQLTVAVEDGHAVTIKDGDCINADGWFKWEQVATEGELLELANRLYSKEWENENEMNTNEWRTIRSEP
jgi:hypothetical protein